MERHEKPGRSTGKHPNLRYVGSVILMGATSMSVAWQIHQCTKDTPRDTVAAPQSKDTPDPIDPPVQFTTTQDAGAVAPEFDGGLSQADSTADAGAPPPPDEDKETALRKACQNLWDSSPASKPGEVYTAFRKVAELVGDNEDPDGTQNAMYELSELATACNFRLDQLVSILKTALAQSDTRIARVVNELVQRRCLGEKIEMDSAVTGEHTQDLIGCRDFPQYSPRQQCGLDVDNEMLKKCTPDKGERVREKCVDEFQTQKNDCEELSEVNPLVECFKRGKERQQARTAENEKAIKTCADREAAKFGVDGGKLKELDAIARASTLSTLRLVLLDPEIPPTEEEIYDYLKALRPTIMAPDDSDFFGKLGVADYSEFERKYLLEVAAAIKQNHGKQYPDVALSFLRLRTFRIMLMR